jgi:hypothetical protein
MQTHYHNKKTEYGEFIDTIGTERYEWIIEHWGEETIWNAFINKSYRLPKVGELPKLNDMNLIV